MVDAMLDLVRAETELIDSRFLEPACGSGNFLVPVLRRKLAAVEAKYSTSEFEKRHYAIFAVMSIYGIELLEDNVAECRESLLRILEEYLGISRGDVVSKAAASVLGRNIVHGDARSMVTSDGTAITFAEWGYLGKGKYQRRDFRFDTLTQMSSFGEDTLFAEMGKHDVFTPIASFPPLGLKELASG
jgi:hypothetical protein